MAVLVIKSEPKCKLCQHPRRVEIDELLELRADRARDKDGNFTHTTDQVIAMLRADFEVENPTLDNLKIHWRKHCARTQATTAVAAQEAAADKLIQILTGEVKVDVDTDLDRLWAIGLAEIEARISRGERSGITPDLMVRIAQEKGRRQHNEVTHELLTALTGGIGQALGQGVKQIGRAEVVDADVRELTS